MKKFFAIILFVFFSTLTLADEKKYSNYLNENINEFGWKIVRFNYADLEDRTIEIYTLKKKNNILKCIIIYEKDALDNYCQLP